MKILWCQVAHGDITSGNLSYEGISWHENVSMTISPRKQFLFSVQELLMKVEQPPVIVRIFYASLCKSMFQNDCNLTSHSGRTLGRHHKAVFVPWLLNCTKSAGKKFSYITIQESCQGKNCALLTIMYSFYQKESGLVCIVYLAVEHQVVSWCFT